MKQDETFVRGGNNPYARSNGGQRTGSETYIPGMNDVNLLYFLILYSIFTNQNLFSLHSCRWLACKSSLA
jgi:hypothetical protein